MTTPTKAGTQAGKVPTQEQARHEDQGKPGALQAMAHAIMAAGLKDIKVPDTTEAALDDGT